MKRFINFWKRYWNIPLIVLLGIVWVGACVQFILFSNYHVEYLEYANVDFEWVDDFGNYEVVIPYEEHSYYLTVRDSKVKFIYAGEDFLNFVVVNHEKRIVDGLDDFSIKSFYINLAYKEMELWNEKS